MRRRGKGKVTPAKRERVFTRDGYRCMVADCEGTDLTIDHVIPVSRGGDSNEGNLLSLCHDHNAQKDDRTWDEFIDVLWRERPVVPLPSTARY